MRIEEGEYYRTRDGRKVGPANVAYGGRFEFSGPHTHCHGADGKYIGHDRDLDIVAEWTDEGPIVTETVTVRRLEPGVYGRLSIDHDAPGYVSIGLTDPKGTGVEEGHRRSFNSAQLRDLARVATELAEYLDVARPQRQNPPRPRQADR